MIHENELVNLKNNLKLLIGKHQLNATKLCKATGIPKSTISDWLLGNSPKNIKQVKILADHFNITIDELVFGETSLDPFSRNEDVSELLSLGNFDVYLKKRK